MPVFSPHDLRDPGHLVADLGDIGLGETIWFLTKRNIELSVAVKADHPVKIRPVQKQKIQRIAVFIERIPHLPVIRFAILLQQAAMVFQ